MDEIKHALASNVTKLMERDGKMSEMSARAQRLEAGSEMFQVRSDSVSVSVLLYSVLFRKQQGN